MFDHVTIRLSDRSASERFYETVLRTLGIEQTHSGEHYAEWNDFSLAQATTRNRPLAVCTSPSWRSRALRSTSSGGWGTEAGYPDDGAPGPRPRYSEDYYGAFLLDPDGNSAEAVHHDEVGTGIDHLWIRVADVAAAKRFYEVVAPHAGFRLNRDLPDRAQFTAPSGSFSVVAGAATEQVHMAFSASDNATVDAFHRAATEVGYRDNGAPGERPVYHAGYYGAYVLDPDGNNIEVVNHNR